MFCEDCKKELPREDFMLKQEICYKCSYKMRCEVNKAKKIKKKKFCKLCKKEVVTDENLKKRQRNVYCSKECSEQAHKAQTMNYWTRKLSRSYPLALGMYT